MTYHEDVATTISFAHEVLDLSTWELCVVSAHYQAQEKRDSTLVRRIEIRFRETLQSSFHKINLASSEIFHRRLREHLS